MASDKDKRDTETTLILLKNLNPENKNHILNLVREIVAVRAKRLGMTESEINDPIGTRKQERGWKRTNLEIE